MQSQMTVTYRMMSPGEAPAVLALVERVAAEFVEPDFTNEGTAFFREAVTQFVLHTPANHCILVALQGAEVVGMIDVRDLEHISLFYVDKKIQRQGVGRGLMALAVARCCGANTGRWQIDVHSSPYAVPVYERLGFKQTGPKQKVNGICFVPMVLTTS